VRVVFYEDGGFPMTELIPHTWNGQTYFVSGFSELAPENCVDCIAGDCMLWHEDQPCEDCKEGRCGLISHSFADIDERLGK